MCSFVAFLRIAAPLVLGVATIDIAWAASPAYCALYARENARIDAQSSGDASPASQRLQDQTYYRCLNQDEEPQFPTKSAYFGMAVQDITGETANVNPAPVAKPKPKPKKLAFRGSGRGSGLTPWTAEWVTWCEAHYRSFDATTGFVLTLSRERKLCP
jgi:BA14K-like protein